jgi:TolA-binding protein
MLARFVLTVLMLVTLTQTTTWAQTAPDSSGEIRVTKTSYLAQEPGENQVEDSVADLEKKLQLMELRLRELEVDVEDNLAEQPDKEKQQEESYNVFGKRLGVL